MLPVFVDHEGRILSNNTQVAPSPEVEEVSPLERLMREAEQEALRQSTKKTPTK